MLRVLMTSLGGACDWYQRDTMLRDGCRVISHPAGGSFVPSFSFNDETLVRSLFVCCLLRIPLKLKSRHTCRRDLRYHIVPFHVYILFERYSPEDLSGAAVSALETYLR